MSELAKQIKLNEDIYNWLTEIGRKDETYNDVVKRLLEFYKKHSVIKTKQKNSSL